jgi:glycerate kinase
LLDIIHFNETVRDADLVITGEGSADRQTLMGKLPMGILRHSAGIPVWLIAGRISDRDQLLQAGFSRVACINPPAFPLEEAMRPDVARQHIINTFKLLIKNAPPF